MAEINQVTLSGHLVADPTIQTMETKYGRKSVCRARMAQNRYRKKSDGSFEKAETAFFDIEAWAEKALILESSFQKGSHLVVFGRLRMESWKDRETGANRQKLVLNVESVWDGVRVSEAPEQPRDFIRDDYARQQEYERSQEPRRYEDEYSQERPPRRRHEEEQPRLYDNRPSGYGPERENRKR